MRARRDGKLFCWRHDWAGALGLPKDDIPCCTYEDLGGRCAMTPRRPKSIPQAAALSVGGSRSCRIDKVGGLSGWGAWTDEAGGTSWCGASPSECDAFATPVEGLERVVAIAIAVGASRVCALDADGAVWCWGYGAAGLGDGSSRFELVERPVRVQGFGG